MRERIGYLPNIGEESFELKILSFEGRLGKVEFEIPLLSQRQLEKVIATVKKASATVLKSMTVTEIISIIDRAIETMLDRNSPYRRMAEELLPIVTGYDAEMIRLGLTRFLKKFRKPELQRFVIEDFDNPLVLDDFQPRIKGGYSKAMGPDLIFHVWAGNVPALPLWSLISGLLVKAGNIGKVSSSEPLFAGWFAQILVDICPQLADALAIVWWKGGDEEREKVILPSSDVVVGYGGNPSLESLRKRASHTTRFLAFGHKISFGVIGNSALDARKVWKLAHQAAFDMIQFDQQGCYSPQIYYVQKGGKIAPSEFAKYLAHELESFEKRFPRRGLSFEEVMEVNEWRNQEEISIYSNNNKELLSAHDGRWMVVYEEEAPFSPTCLNRVVKVITFDDIDDIAASIQPYHSFLQTVGIAATPNELFQWAQALGKAGVTRVTAIGEMTSPESGWHHDGRFNLLDLVQMVDIESSAKLLADDLASYHE